MNRITELLEQEQARQEPVSAPETVTEDTESAALVGRALSFVRVIRNRGGNVYIKGTVPQKTVDRRRNKNRVALATRKAQRRAR